MAFKNQRNYQHGTAAKRGVLLVNLGTPEAPTAQALRPYLKQFLSDPRVVEIPRLIWWFILNLVILPFRPKRSAEAYASIWTNEGSPLAVHTRQLSKKVGEALNSDTVIVDYAMRYGSPSIDSVLQSFANQGVEQLVVLPLYPQYSCSTTASVFDAIADDFNSRRWIPELRFINQYHDAPEYIAAITASIRSHQEDAGKPDKLVFSFHGTPKRFLTDGDPYHCQCQKSARLIAEALGLSDDEYLVTFQSRFGKAEWLQPYTDKTLKQLPAQGVTSVQLVCPGFAADCLETLEEICEENRDYFLEAGGQQFDYIKALNSSDDHVAMVVALVEQHCNEWLLTDRSSSEALAKRTGHP